MSRSYDPSGPHSCPDAYLDEPARADCPPPPSGKMTEAEYLANIQKWLRVKRERETKERGR